METIPIIFGKNNLEVTDREKDDTIKRAMMLCASSHSVRPTKSMLITWKIALADLSIELIDLAAEYCIKQRISPYMPSTGEFIEIAYSLKKLHQKVEWIDED